MKKIRFLMCFVLVLLLAGCKVTSGYIRYDNFELYNEYKEEIKLDETETYKKLDIDWISGEIEIIRGADFTISEEVIDGKYYPLYWYSQDGIIHIAYVESGLSNSKISGLSKRLTITCPYDLENINIDNVSASIKIDLDDLKKVDIDNISGKVNIKANAIEVTDIDTVSGDINLTIYDTTDISIIDIDSVSGDANIKLDSSRGYDLKHGTVSGKYTTDFTNSIISLNQFDMYVDTVSGSLDIKKIER